ncbi:MAG: hypothetical protein ACOX0U_09155 [Oscillospiraceae bacterium]|jgi:hypothetical protein
MAKLRLVKNRFHIDIASTFNLNFKDNWVQTIVAADNRYIRAGGSSCALLDAVIAPISCLLPGAGGNSVQVDSKNAVNHMIAINRIIFLILGAPF